MEVMARAAPGLTIPPPVFEDMQAEVVDFVPGDAETHVGARLTVRMPVLERYRNPMGHVQGGIVAAMADNAVGPLSYLVAPPSVTTQLTISYLAPLPPGLPSVDVTATLAHRGGRTLLFDAEVRAPDGDLLAAARAAHTIVRLPRGERGASRAPDAG